MGSRWGAGAVGKGGGGGGEKAGGRGKGSERGRDGSAAGGERERERWTRRVKQTGRNPSANIHCPLVFTNITSTASHRDKLQYRPRSLLPFFHKYWPFYEDFRGSSSLSLAVQSRALSSRFRRSPQLARALSSLPHGMCAALTAQRARLKAEFMNKMARVIEQMRVRRATVTHARRVPMAFV